MSTHAQQNKTRRDDDHPRPFYRASTRILQLNGKWYYATREGDQGPYESPQEAERELKRFIDTQMELQLFQLKRAKWHANRDRKNTLAGALGERVQTLQIVMD